MRESFTSPSKLGAKLEISSLLCQLNYLPLFGHHVAPSTLNSGHLDVHEAFMHADTLGALRIL